MTIKTLFGSLCNCQSFCEPFTAKNLTRTVPFVITFAWAKKIATSSATKLSLTFAKITLKKSTRGESIKFACKKY